MMCLRIRHCTILATATQNQIAYASTLLTNVLYAFVIFLFSDCFVLVT